MTLNTRRLFHALLPKLGIDTVCDVGSMNGAEALMFRRCLPQARVIAFEANPENFRQMRIDTRLDAQRIEVLPVAVTNFDGETSFHLVPADYTAIHDRRGMSSLYLRVDPRLRAHSIPVRTTRLDSCLGVNAATTRHIALWIDVEGKAFEAIEGARGIFSEILLLHVEVETQPCIGEMQKLYPEVRQLLESAGFRELGTDRPVSTEQFNALYVRRDLPPSLVAKIDAQARRNRWRAWCVNGLRRLCPSCVRRLRSLLGLR